MKKTVCVDLDGVLAQYDGWKGHEHIGDPIPGAVAFVDGLLDFARVVIHTSRCADDDSRKDWTDAQQKESTDLVRQWLIKHGFTGGISIWTKPGKPMASAYVDDRAVVCRPTKDVENQDFDTALRLCRALVEGEPLGSQGSYSDGQLSEDDEGDMKLMISRQGGCVRIDFGKPVGWLAFPKEQALGLAGLIAKHAEAL